MNTRQRKARFNRNYPVKTFRCGMDLAAFLNAMPSEMRQQFVTRALRAYVEGRQ